jgi:ligand-binding sensor domain-containing protein/serine phosphatase RsbU (regulator of sigma subunit)
MRMKKIYKGILIIIAFISPLTGAIAQHYKFRSFGIEQGLAYPYIYTIEQDKKGYLWIGTAEGLFRLDGTNIKAYTGINKDDNFITASCTDSNGNIWLGHQQGGITVYDGKDFNSIATGNLVKSPIIAIRQDSKGNIWCASQSDGLLVIGSDRKVKHCRAGERPVHSFAIATTGELMIGSDDGMHIYSPGTGHKLTLLHKVEGVPSTKVQCIERGLASRDYWAGTEDEGAFYIRRAATGKYIAERVGTKFKLSEENVQYVMEDHNYNLWLCTFGSGLVRLSRTAGTKEYTGITRFDNKNGLDTKYVKRIFRDREHNTWIGTYGAGLSVLQDNFFTFYPSQEYGNVISVMQDEKGYWLGTDNELLNIGRTNVRTAYSSASGLPSDPVTSVYRAPGGALWVGTSSKGVFVADSSMRFKNLPVSDDRLLNSINAIAGSGSTTWIATRGGLLQVRNDSITHFTIADGLVHNNINHLYCDSKGNLWMAAPGNYISVLEGRKIRNYPVAPSGGMLNIVSVTGDKKGNIWLATQGNGVLRFTPSTTTVKNYTTENGLASNYCYSISPDGAGQVWIGHRNALSRISRDESMIKTFGASDGINGDCSLNAMAKDHEGSLWIGTTGGIIRYDPSSDRKNLAPPVLNITSVKFSDKEVDLSAGSELPYDIYKLRIEFSGLTFCEPERVRYQYKLEGHDVDWSELSPAGYALYNRVPDGDYTFMLRAYNSDGVYNEEPLKLSFTVLSPLWKRWWFILAGICTGSYALFVIIGVREKRMKDFQAQLKDMLDQRTREVVHQKEQLERKNKDITDSINYAKRIQDAILPDTGILKNALPDSFVFYRPRDIVSGDFYWFETFGNRIVIACADATGHGVPGALMSMIGSTLLKELCMKEAIQSPADMLNALNTELSNVLKKHENTNAQDSMDIIVCEIDLLTYKVRFASAMRPAIIYHRGEQLIFKKKQHLIGSPDKNNLYTNTEYQLEKGDCIYLFTDGYPDQFGGDNGKKMKIERFREAIHSLRKLPMSEQYVKLRTHFESWKGEHEQVDDILVMGIRL